VYIQRVASQTFAGKTGTGSAGLGATRLVIDVEVQVTAITSVKIRKLNTFSTTQRLQYAGSYGLAFDGGAGKLVVVWHPLLYTKQDITELKLQPATDVFWDLPLGITATFKVSY
jgi:hypothetical protein